MQTTEGVRQKYCLYARKSSEADEKQALSIDSQINEMLALAKKENMEIVEVRQESHSAKASGTRPVFNGIVEDIGNGLFTSILTWAPDRISRNAGDLGRIVDLMDRGALINIRTHNQNFTDSPNDKFMLMILCSQAKLENDNKSINIKRGMRAKCKMGIRPGGTPLGYKMLRSDKFGEPSKVVIDEERAPFIKKCFEYAKAGVSGRQINDYLTQEGFRSKNNKQVALSATFRILQETFYYGDFEYPKGSGNWYQGSHEPLITKKLFEDVREKLKVPPKSKWGRKNFYFSKLFKCGNCGSGVSGEEKFNRFGTRYVYYKCNKFGGKNRYSCREKYIREEKLIQQLTKIVDQIKNQHEYLAKRLEKEVHKFNQLQAIASGGKSKNRISTQDYIEYILTNGSNGEKSKLLQFVDGQLCLKEGEVIFQN